MLFFVYSPLFFFYLALALYVHFPRLHSGLRVFFFSGHLLPKVNLGVYPAMLNP